MRRVNLRDQVHKNTALRLLRNRMRTVPGTDILRKIRLDIDSNKKIFIEVKFYRTDDSLYVIFGSQHHPQLLDRFRKARREDKTQDALNEFIQKLTVDFQGRIIEELFACLIGELNSDAGCTSTIYAASGIPACLAVMIAAVSPPHFLYTFGMPAFSNAHPFSEMQKKAMMKKRRLQLEGIAVKPLVAAHFVSPKDKTFIPLSDYTLPPVTMGATTEPSLLHKIIARCLTWNRSAEPNLEAYFNENSSFRF